MLTTNPSLLDTKLRNGLLLALLLLFSWFTGLKNLLLEHATTAEDTTRNIRPNILMIVVDDLGYNDTTAINTGGLKTPHLKQLASEGVTFTRHYADATCTPSRIALLTGRYPERSGFRPIGSEIPREYATIAEQLQLAGYTTYLTGKWHAGEERPESEPQNKGFQHWFGFLNQWELAGEISVNNIGVRRPTYHNPQLRTNGGALQPHQGHLTDILTQHSIEKLRELNTENTPWFLYHAFLAPHTPIQPAPRYRDRFPSTPEGKYTALVTQLDDAIGELLAAVDRENTLVVFVSDNGGTNAARDNNYPFHGKKNEPLEGAYRTPLIISWPSAFAQDRTVATTVMNVDIYPTLLAAAQLPTLADIDGENLWPLLVRNTPTASAQRERSWEVYVPNINTLGYSYLSPDGTWRLASANGMPPALFHLASDPTGSDDVAAEQPERLEQLRSAFEESFWRKSLIPVRATLDEPEQQRTYSGFELLRSPYRFGFSIGLNIEPLPPAIKQGTELRHQILAQQKGIWELRFLPDQGLEWHIAGNVLRDPSFVPTQCNAVILTGYLQPKGHLDIREPTSTLKLYSNGSLRDGITEVEPIAPNNAALSNPTQVNFGGKALFSNVMLSTYSEGFTPRLKADYLELFQALHRERKLAMPGIHLMDNELCQVRGADS